MHDPIYRVYYKGKQVSRAYEKLGSARSAATRFYKNGRYRYYRDHYETYDDATFIPQQLTICTYTYDHAEQHRLPENA